MKANVIAALEVSPATPIASGYLTFGVDEIDRYYF